MSNQNHTIDIYKYIYIASAVLFVVAMLALAGMRGFLPFGTSLVSGGETMFASLLIVRSITMEPVPGTILGRYSDVAYAVQPYVLTDTRRTNGALQYIVQPVGNEEHTTATIMAREFETQALVSIPFLGGLIRILAHPIGLMGLLGVPLLMFFLHGIQLINVSHVLRRARMLSVGSLEHRTVESVASAEQVPTMKDESTQRKGVWATAMRLFSGKVSDGEVQEDYAKDVTNDGMTIELKKWREDNVKNILVATPGSHRYGM